MKKRASVKVLLMALLLLMVFAFPAHAAKVKLNKKTATLTVGKTVKLKVTGTKSKVKWSTSNKKVATVTQKGKVRAKKAGKATITAKVAGKKLKCKVIVIKATAAKTSTGSASDANYSDGLIGDGGATSNTNNYADIEAGTGINKTKVLRYTGSGDDVITIDDYGSMHVFRIKGNAEERHFSVTSYDAFGKYLDLLVNTSDAYEGTTYDEDQNAKTLEIKATGPWEIEVVSIYTTPYTTSGNSISGTGDSVIRLNGGNTFTASIRGNNDERHFSVISRSHTGKYLDLLVNTSDVYSGRVKLDDDPWIFVINAVGSWTITFS